MRKLRHRDIKWTHPKSYLVRRTIIWTRSPDFRVHALASNYLQTFFVKEWKGSRFQWLLSLEGWGCLCLCICSRIYTCSWPLFLWGSYRRKIPRYIKRKSLHMKFAKKLSLSLSHTLTHTHKLHTCIQICLLNVMLYQIPWAYYLIQARKESLIGKLSCHYHF